MENEHRVAIIGSGLSGLSAALDLCNNGIRPVIFEKNATYGGYATNFVKDGYRFEVSLHYVGPVFNNILDRLGIFDEVKLIDVKTSGVIDCKEFNDACDISTFKFHDEALSYIGYMITKYPNEERSIRKLFSLGTSMLPTSDDMLINKTNPIIAMLKHPASLSSMAKYISKTSKELLDELFTSDDLKREISSLAIILGTPIDAMSAIPYIQTATESYTRGGFYIRGGSQRLVDVMAKRIEQSGGVIRTSSPVSKMKFTDGMVTGVVANGSTIPVDSVIYCCDPINLVTNIARHEKIFDRNIRQIPIASAALVVHLGLDVDVKDEYGLDRADYTINTPDMSFNIAIYSNVDPSCCKRGNSVITITGLGYDDFKRRSIKELSRISPGIERHIMVDEYLTPDDFEQMTWNTNGTFGGFQTTPDQIRSPLSHTTLIKNLFVAGQWIGNGAGYINTTLGGLNVSAIWQKRMIR